MVQTQKQSPYLEAALDAARWIRTTSYETPAGLAWLPDPDRPDQLATISSPPSLYSGNAGVVLFFLELAHATGDDAWLEDARRGGHELAASWRAALDFPALIPNPNVSLDFQFGLGGTAFTLVQLWRATSEEHYRAAAGAIADHIVAAARPVGAGVEWIGSPSLGMGDGSIILVLLWLADQLDEPAYRDIALQGGRRLLEQAEPDPRGGLRWRTPMLEAFGAPKGAAAPNFELGTAGVAFVMAKLFDVSGDQPFLDAAREGAAHVQALAKTDGDSALLFYREPDFTDLFYLGYCHGPVGTSRLFYLLDRLTGEQDYRDWTRRFARGVMTSGAPEQQTPGLWNVVCQCCGTAGITDYFTSLWVALGDPDDLAFATRSADETLRRGEAGPAGTRWYQAWTRTQPDELASETGYMIGAAGVGTAMLHLHLALQGCYSALLFPDNPFPAAVGSGV